MKKHFIEEILCDFASTPISYDIYIVANTQEETLSQRKPYVTHASLDELFSQTEFAEIASAIFDIFGYGKVFYSELDFLEYALRNNLKPDDCIVYNLARDGIHTGKKSLIPAFCDLIGLRYTGSDAFVISLLRNKFVYTTLLHQHGFSVPQSWIFDELGEFTYGSPSENQKIILKNIQESASIGLTVDNILIYTNCPTVKETMARCCHNMNCRQALAQEYIAGVECEVLVLENNGQYIALDPIAIEIQDSDIISSEISNSYRYFFKPLADLFPQEVCEKICNYSEQAANLLGVRNYARFDFRVDSDQNCFLIDIAGTPYTIRHSSISYLFQTVYGLEYKDIYKVITFLATQKYR